MCQQFLAFDYLIVFQILTRDPLPSLPCGAQAAELAEDGLDPFFSEGFTAASALCAASAWGGRSFVPAPWLPAASLTSLGLSSSPRYFYSFLS